MCVCRLLGDPNLQSPQVMPVIPPDVLEQALRTARSGDRELFETESHNGSWQLLMIVTQARQQPGFSWRPG